MFVKVFRDLRKELCELHQGGQQDYGMGLESYGTCQDPTAGRSKFQTQPMFLTTALLGPSTGLHVAAQSLHSELVVSWG